MPKKIENMDLDEFEDHIKTLDDDAFMAAWTEYGEGVQEARKRLLAFSKEHQKRVRLEQLRNMALSEADLELLQVVGPVGIASEESVNGSVNTEPDEVNRG